MILKRSVRNNTNREMRENRESLCVLFLLVRVVRVVRGSCFLSRLFVVILTAKAFIVCFLSFVPFALFAVHGIQREWPLYFVLSLSWEEKPEEVRGGRKTCFMVQSENHG